MYKMKSLTLALAASLFALGSATAAAHDKKESSGLDIWQGVSIDLQSLDIDKRFSGDGSGITLQKQLFTFENNWNLDVYGRFNLQMLSDDETAQHIEQKGITIGLNWNVTDNQRLFVEESYMHQDLRLVTGDSTLSYEQWTLGAESMLGERLAVRGAIEYRDNTDSETGFSVAIRAIEFSMMKPEVGFRKIGDDESLYVSLGFNF